VRFLAGVAAVLLRSATICSTIAPTAAMRTLTSPVPSSATTEPSLALPRSFWKDFAKSYWDRKPVLFSGLFSAHYPTTEEMFAAIVEAGARRRRNDFSHLFRFYIEHAEGPNGMPQYLTPSHIEPYLPLPEDGNADDYVARVTRQLGGKRFGLALRHVSRYRWNNWLQMRSFLSGFHEAIGVPMGSDPELYFGNYLYTPFGIHKDSEHVFYFVVHGKKTLSFWPFESFAHRDEVAKGPGAIEQVGYLHLKNKTEEQQLLAQATFLTGQAGDLLYWPASYWHRAEPGTGLAIAISFGMVFGPPPFDEGRAIDCPERLRHTDIPGGGVSRWRLPPVVRKYLRRQSQRRSRTAAERDQIVNWVCLLTRGGMGGPAPEALNEAPLTHNETIRATPTRPIVSVLLPQGQLMVSANGHFAIFAASPSLRRRIERLLSALNRGKPLNVKALEAAFFSRSKTRPFSRRNFHTLLNDLVRWRAVQRGDPPAPSP
jgi:hypothetical protein